MLNYDLIEEERCNHPMTREGAREEGKKCFEISLILVYNGNLVFK